MDMCTCTHFSYVYTCRSKLLAYKYHYLLRINDCELILLFFKTQIKLKFLCDVGCKYNCVYILFCYSCEMIYENTEDAYRPKE